MARDETGKQSRGRAGVLVPWACAGLWLASAPLLVHAGTSNEMKRGAVVSVDITLVASDASELACAGNTRPFGYDCAFRADGRPAAESGRGVLVPCLTNERVGLFVPNLFAQPEIRQRVSAERARGLAFEAQERFTARCRVRVLGHAPELRTRFTNSAPFGPAPGDLVVEPVVCTVER